MKPPVYEEPMTFGEWVATLLLLCVPLLGILFLISWAVTGGGKASRRNFARANLFVAALLLIGGGALALSSGLFSKAGLDRLRATAAAQTEPAAEPQPEAPEAAAAAPVPAAAPTPAAAPAVAASPAAAAPPPRSRTIVAGEPSRTFHSADGRKIEAQVIGLTDDEVTIRRTDGREVTADMTRFSPDDVAYFMTLRNGRGTFD